MSSPRTRSGTDAVRPHDERFRRLRIWNLALTAVHLGQALAILLLAGDFGVSVTSTFPDGPPGTPTAQPEQLFDVRIGAAVAVFLLLAAVDHALTGTVMRHTYEIDLTRGVDRFRWIEYSFSATLMVLLIAAYKGITDVTGLLGIAGASVAMILFGWLQERMNPPDRTRTTMMPFWFGTVAGLFPWLAIATNVVGADTVPTFVLGIFVVQFLLFASFGANQWLQYRGVGPWRSYLFGEQVYLVLSLVAKSLLAWQIYGGSLAD